MPRPLHAVILAGGEGKRMKSPVPKVLIDLLGRPVVGHVVEAVRPMKPASCTLVGGRHLPALRAALAGDALVGFVRQAKPLGTGHAVKQAMRLLPARGADVLIMNGDGPLVTTPSLRALVAAHRRSGVDVTVVTAVVPDPAGLGRIVRDGRGRFERIVEQKDATAGELAIREINSGQYVVRAEALHRLLPKIGRGNAQREYYLTDLVKLAAGSVAAFAMPDPDEARGINTPGELDEVRRIVKRRILDDLRAGGVVVVDPDLSYVESGVKVGSGAVLMPFVVLRRPATIAARCVVGPFAHVRGDAVLEEESRIGNFVEVKSSRIGKGSKAMHLAYLGDARIGSQVNVGAGAITANFDGRRKHQTIVEDGASLGSGTILVAPVSVGRHARTGAGSVVPAGQDVPDGSTVVGVPAREHRDGGRGSRTPRRRGSPRRGDRARRSGRTKGRD